jgi:hypothetical protein
MNSIHRFLDRSSVPTWRYERAVRVLFELILLVACAAPVVSGWRSALAQGLVIALRLHQAETGREKASIIGRAKEAGLTTEPDVCREKRARLSVLSAREALIAWTWPALVVIVSAAETKSIGLVATLGLVATMARVWFDKRAMPAWRKSRVEWRKWRENERVEWDCT